VAAEGTPAQLKRQVGEAGVELTFASPADAGRVAPALTAATVDGARVRVPTDGSVAHVRSVLSVVETAGVVPEHWEVRAPTLDDVFLALTGHVGQDRPARPAEVAA
jgi:ABC-2 type transport system ATP-binding protein